MTTHELVFFFVTAAIAGWVLTALYVAYRRRTERREEDR